MTGQWMKSKGTFDLFIGFASRTWIGLSYNSRFPRFCFNKSTNVFELLDEEVQI